MSFWDIVWLIIFSYAFIAYLMMLFSLLGDLFRDHEIGGGVKALWLLFFLLVPFLSAIAYLLVRGNGMAERSMHRMQAAKAEQDQNIQQVAGQTSPAAQIAQAKTLRDSGEITPAEFDSPRLARFPHSRRTVSSPGAPGPAGDCSCGRSRACSRHCDRTVHELGRRRRVAARTAEGEMVVK